MSVLSRIYNALNPKQLERDLAEEMSDHIQRRAADYMRSGLDCEAAHHRAACEFGNIALTRERSRDARLIPFIDEMLHDVRYAVRAMRRSPVFFGAAILSLSLAIAANTAVFSLVDAVFWRTLPVRQPSRLFTLSTPGIQQPGSPLPDERQSFSYPLFSELSAGG